jgi:hypothetical protein
MRNYSLNSKVLEIIPIDMEGECEMIASICLRLFSGGVTQKYATIEMPIEAMRIINEIQIDA